MILFCVHVSESVCVCVCVCVCEKQVMICTVTDKYYGLHKVIYTIMMIIS